LLAAGVIATWRQIRISQQGQVTERFTRAIDQLGNQEQSVRMGGVYALERLARDSTVDASTIAEILTAYILSHARIERPDKDGPPQEALASPPSDVQAAITALGRSLSGFANDLHRINLTGIRMNSLSLPRASFLGSNLSEADLRGAHLQESRFVSSNLRNANATGANLREAVFLRADLRQATLLKADCRNAHLQGADMRDATLGFPASSIPYLDTQPTNLSGAKLAGANLSGANLKGVDLRAARIGPDTNPSAFVRGFVASVPSFQDVLQSEANFEGAKASRDTRWPHGFDWKAAGVIVEDEEPEV
jgi:uncharacterized protein YjbI with pentapeptide repeats